MNTLFKRYGVVQTLFTLGNNINDNTDKLPF